MNEPYTGHCLCGKIQFQAQGDPLWVSYCHCDSCRHATGSAVAVYVGFSEDRVIFDGNTPKKFTSSPAVIRGFCPDCGSPIFYQSERWPGEIHLFIGIIDQAAQLPPQIHVYTKEQMPWLHIEDPLPRHKTVPSEGGS